MAADLVAYASGTIVSRAVIKKPAGSATLFSFDKGEGLSEHTAPFDALVQVLDGVAEVTVDNVPHRVAVGEIIIMPAHKPHAPKALERFKMMLVMIQA